MPVPPVTLSDPKIFAVPCVAAGAIKLVKLMAFAIEKVTIVVLLTLSESVAVTVSYKVPLPTELATFIAPVFVSMVKPLLGPEMLYLIAPVPVPTSAEISVKV